MNKIERYISGGVISLLALLIAAFALLCSVMAYEAASYPYNSEGRYYDGMVVHQSYSWFGYGIMAFGGWAITAFLAWFAYLLLFRPRAN